jgi:hypothetical protein
VALRFPPQSKIIWLRLNVFVYFADLAVNQVLAGLLNEPLTPALSPFGRGEGEETVAVLVLVLM